MEGCGSPTAERFGPPPTLERPVLEEGGFNWGGGWSSDGMNYANRTYWATGTIRYSRRRA